MTGGSFQAVALSLWLKIKHVCRCLDVVSEPAVPASSSHRSSPLTVIPVAFGMDADKAIVSQSHNILEIKKKKKSTQKAFG